ncbi:MAG TPA: sigma-70 family RNA polymerase sigma factor [Anaerolineales bacterium]|nr:sigma-70 family RNA polymerase sigma factor [Anaerolineales bacterium]
MQRTQTLDEPALVRAAQIDAQAFGALYDRYVQRVYRYCFYRTSHAPDAEDLTAQIFLAALEALPRYRQDGHFAGWLFSIARKKVSDFHRFHHRAPQVPLDESALPPIHTDLATDVETAQRRERLLNLIQALAEEERDLIHLRYVAELSFSEMARTLQKNEDAVKKSLYRLIARLKHELEADHE